MFEIVQGCQVSIAWVGSLGRFNNTLCLMFIDSACHMISSDIDAVSVDSSSYFIWPNQ
jgi:hypothetical protein